ncbi:hypothetical protein IAR55_002139 [Kwoniella newhampshirensis]|uniref:Right handed beta helix domain-containing protein n=1 Tax=Kwoniella newhampshirensis TaxID=1651941 RepID=A0AAW0YQ39_9TREE
MIRPALPDLDTDGCRLPKRRRRRYFSKPSQGAPRSIASVRLDDSLHPPPSPSRLPARIRRSSPKLSTIFLLTTLLFILLPLVSAAPPCVRFADYDSINQMFIDGGPGAKVLLCPNKLYRLSGTIVFTAADQELATYGYPTGSERAVLRVEGKDTATAVQGDCRRCARVSIRSLVVDGNRKKLGRMKDSELATGLVVLGGNEGQSVKNSLLKHPRGFTAIHIREGDKLSCTGAVIEKNEIGPVGEEYDPEKDGDDPEMSPLGRPLADGVSIACRDSFVRDNTFYDNTDAAIVIYCSPGTLIHANHIFARTSSAMAGILLVDSTPFDGDYTGTVVRSNIIDAATRSIRVGIGLGSTVWSDDTETILKGGSVLGNGLKGRYMGYGIAAAGLKGWTVKDNWDEARHEGRKSARCFDDPVNPDPVGLLYNKATIEESTFQSGFLDHEFQYIVCIDGLYDKANPPKLPPNPIDPEPTQPEHDAERNTAEEARSTSPEAEEPDADSEAPSTGFATGSEVMDDILEHSQQRMLEAIDHLNRRVDLLAANVKIDGGDDTPKSLGEVLDPAMSAHMEKLQRRVEHLEFSQRGLLESAVGVRSAIQAWDQEMASVAEWQYDILLDVRHKLDLHSSPSDPSSLDHLHERDGEGHAHPSIERDGLRSKSEKARLQPIGEGEGEGDGWGWLGKVVLIQGILVCLIWSGRRWLRNRRVHGKLL